jgi:hypothetical protein
MNKYLIRIWVEEIVYNLRTVWVEADSFESIQAMNNQEFEDAIDEFDDVIDHDYGSIEPDMWDLETIELDDEHIDNIIPPDEKPDVEDIDPNAGRGK